MLITIVALRCPRGTEGVDGGMPALRVDAETRLASPLDQFMRSRLEGRIAVASLIGLQPMRQPTPLP